MPYIPEESEEVDRIIDEVRAVADQQDELSREMDLWINAVKEKMLSFGPVCAELAEDIDSANEAIFAEGFAEQHYPALYLVRILRSCYGLKEGLFTNPAERAEEINTLRSRIKDLLYEMAYPLALKARKIERKYRRGGKNSHGLTAEERQKRNELIQAEVDRLCLERKLPYRRACVIVAAQKMPKIYKAIFPKDEEENGFEEEEAPEENNIPKTLSHDRIKKLTTNPHKKHPSK